MWLAGFKEITVDVLKEKLTGKEFALLLDVRGPEEYAAGHVPGARNAPLQDLNSDYVQNSELKDLKEDSIAVICGIGKRSAQATVRLTKARISSIKAGFNFLQVLGFKDVTNVAAGTKEWIERGYDIEK